MHFDNYLLHVQFKAEQNVVELQIYQNAMVSLDHMTTECHFNVLVCIHYPFYLHMTTENFQAAHCWISAKD